MKRCCISLFLAMASVFFISSYVNGQPSYIFHHLTTHNGLSNSNVRTILKDSYGFLWIGTASGLNRYDGYGFKVYTANPGSPNSLLTNDIMGLQEDGLGNIWIRGNSYMVYNREKDNFITNVPEFLKEFGIDVAIDGQFNIYIDRMHDLWVFENRRVFFYNIHKKSLKVFNLETILDDVANIGLSDDGKSIFSILKSGRLLQINKQTGRQALLDLKNSLYEETYIKMYVDSQSGIWIVTDRTDLIYYRKTPSSDWKKLFLNSANGSNRNRVLSLLDDENGRMWIGTDHNGLFLFDKTNETLFNLLEDPNTNYSIASNNVGCLYKDNSGIIWMGHFKKGISYYHESFLNIVNVEHPECRNINSMLEDRHGNLWLGTDGNGLFVKDKANVNAYKKQPLGNCAVVSLLEDRNGRIWIGTYLDGLYFYENGKFSQFTKKNSRLLADDIWDLKEDRYGNLWIATLAGGIQYIPKNESLDSLKTVCEEVTYPLDMHYDGGDNFYVGTVFGLYIIDITTGNYSYHMGNAKSSQKFSQDLISNVYKDSHNNIWIGHPGGGITLWEMKLDTLYFIDKKTGLTDNIIHGIIEDDYQNIWVTTSNGLSVLSTKSDVQGNVNITTKNFSTKDGFSDNYFNSHSILKLRSGDILLGGTEGYTTVNPHKMAGMNKPLGQVIFTELIVGNKSIQIDSIYKGRKLIEQSMQHTDSVRFQYNDKLIFLHFTTCDLLSADKVKYAYKLDGFDDQWHIIHENKIAFSSLPHGSYRLYVKACNSDGVWNDQASILNITVTPPFFLSNWAITIYILFGLGLILYTFHRTSQHHRRRLEQQKLKMEQEQEANLNEMKLRFFTNVSHDLRTPLTLITTPLQTLLDEKLEAGLRKKLQTINKNAEQLLQLINSLLDFRKLDSGAESLHLRQGDFVRFIREICQPFHTYAIERKIYFSFSNEIEYLSMQFDPEKVQKVVLNLLSNAFKFTSDKGKIDIHVYREKDNVYVSVSDSGHGICNTDKTHIFEPFYQGSHVKTGSGIGLHIVSEYVRLHNGTISVMDNIPQGSIFKFKLQIIAPDHSKEIYTERREPEEDISEQVNKQLLSNIPMLLFVDDNIDFCEFMADSLSDEYKVLIANNGVEAIELLEKYDVGVVVSDVMMPVMDGTELCKRIKTNIHWSHIPVILLTARAAEEYKIEGLEVGADDYITKPFNFNLLKMRIRKFLEWTEKCHISFSQKMDVSPGEITITPLDEQLIESIRLVKSVYK